MLSRKQSIASAPPMPDGGAPADPDLSADVTGSDPGASFTEAENLAAEGRVSEALLHMDKVLASYPQNVRALRWARNFSRQHSGLELAAEYARRLSELEPYDVKNEILLADWHLASGDPETALRRMDALLQAQPPADQAIIRKGKALIALNRAPEAVQLVSEAVDSGIDNVKFLSFARNIALECGALAAARDYALRVEAIAPNDQKNRTTLIQCDLTLGNLEQALARADALVADHPRELSAVMLRAQALIALNRAPEALQLIGEAIDSGVEDVKFLSFARNIALEHGTLATTREYGLRIEAITPDDQKNRATLIQCELTLGEFERALTRADALVADHPRELSAVMLRAQALVALHRVAEGFQILEDAFAQYGDEPRLLALLRTVALNNGFFDKAVRYAIRAQALGTGGIFDKVLLVHSLLAAGHYDQAEQIVGPRREPPRSGPLVKEHHHFWAFRKLQKTAPVFVSAWELALANRQAGSAVPAADDNDLGATMIQYWSQGAPPPDVQIVCDNWKDLFAREKLGRIEVFDRTSAEVWIRENAPEFATQFAQAFHYAMESDIFRIAYASKRPCIYMDIDSWPLEHTASILRFAVNSNSTMLYVRSSRAAIVNGFFVSTPECPFTKELVKQSLAIDLAPLPKTYQVLESSFGPSRYTKVLLDLLHAQHETSASSVEEVRGCSCISLGQNRIFLSHEAAVAGVRPPFPLGYKATDDYWKFFALPS